MFEALQKPFLKGVLQMQKLVSKDSIDDTVSMGQSFLEINWEIWKQIFSICIREIGKEDGDTSHSRCKGSSIPYRNSNFKFQKLMFEIKDSVVNFMKDIIIHC